MTKQKPDVVITKGKHTLVTTNNHTGEVSIKCDWDKLLEEVREATGLIKVTEVKVTKTRKPRSKKD